MLEIHAQWDDEAGAWYATSDDVPGLCVGTDTLDELVEKLKAVIPDLMEMNCGLTGQAFEFRVVTEQYAVSATN